MADYSRDDPYDDEEQEDRSYGDRSYGRSYNDRSYGNERSRGGERSYRGGEGRPRGSGRRGGAPARRRERDVDLPTEPPFIAFVGNLPFDLTDDELWSFFQEKVNCQVLKGRIITDKFSGKPKGFGYVTFENVASLKKALGADGMILMNRELSVDVAEPKRSSRPNRQSRSDVDKWERGTAVAPRRGYRSGREQGPSRATERTTSKPREELPVPEDPPYVGFLGNLSYDVTEDDLEKFFGASKVTNVKLVRTREGRMKGYGFITFEPAEDLRLALKENDNDLCGRPMRIVVADREKMEESEKRAAAASSGTNSPVVLAKKNRSASTKAAAVDTELASFLESLNLQDLMPLFQKERVTMLSLQLLTEEDLKEMRIPTGPRRQIQTELELRNQNDIGEQ